MWDVDPISKENSRNPKKKKKAWSYCNPMWEGWKENGMGISEPWETGRKITRALLCKTRRSTRWENRDQAASPGKSPDPEFFLLPKFKGLRPLEQQSSPGHRESSGHGFSSQQAQACTDISGQASFTCHLRSSVNSTDFKWWWILFINEMAGDCVWESGERQVPPVHSCIDAVAHYLCDHLRAQKKKSTSLFCLCSKYLLYS